MNLPILFLFLASAGWGLTWLPIKYFNDAGMTGPMLVFIAFGSAALLLLPKVISQYKNWRNQMEYVLLIAFFGGLANLAFQLAMSYGDVVRVMILFYLLPVWSVIGGRLFLKEKIDRLSTMAVILALLGAFLILGGFSIFDHPPNWIDLLAIISGFALAMNNITFRAAQTLPMISKVGVMFIGCSAMVGIFLLVTDKYISQVDTSTFGLAVLYGILWISLISFGTQWGVTKIEAGRASIIIVTELVVAVVSSSIILGDVLSAIELIGAAMVLSAAILEGARGTSTQNS